MATIFDVSHARIGILVVAYNAVSTLGEVLDRIPDSLRDSIDVVLVSDDHSTDRTYEAALEYQRTHDALPIAVVRQPRNLGYGGNQKFGYRWLAEHGCDVAVLLHGDGQYAPEVLPEIVAPLLDGRADVVLGSRMLAPGGALDGGMPLYKYVGNKILTRFQNRVSGLVLSEWHSGYRAFSLDALARIPFEENSDGFDFDTEVLLQLLDSGARIVEVPIPTYYGDEICRVNGLAYARDVCRRRRALPPRAPRLRRLAPRALVERLRVEGRARREPSRRARRGGRASAPAGARARPRLRRRPARRRAPRARGISSSGSTATRRPAAEDNVDRLVVADLDAGLPAEAAGGGAVRRRSSRSTCSSTSAIPRASSASCTTVSSAEAVLDLERAEHRSLVPAAADRASAGSTTTGAASSTRRTCASSRGGASPRWPPASAGGWSSAA